MSNDERDDRLGPPAEHSFAGLHPATQRRTTAEALSAILEAVPTENEGPKRIDEFCRQLGMEPTKEHDSLEVIFRLLGPLEVLDISTSPTGEKFIKASSQRASLFLRSYAAYLRECKSILTDWDRGSNPDGPYFARETLSGPQFLYLIERQRSAGREDALPLREAHVSEIIIKARVRGMKGNAYLMQFDSVAQQFQLIGGHRRATDPDDRVAAVRELEEELSKNQFDLKGRDQLVHLATHHMVRMSRAFGVNTRYRFSFFQLKMPIRQLRLGPGDRWISEREITTGVTRDGNFIAIDALGSLDRGLAGGIKSLPLSLSETQRRRLAEIVREHRWEIAGLLIGILGVMITIILYILP